VDLIMRGQMKHGDSIMQRKKTRKSFRGTSSRPPSSRDGGKENRWVSVGGAQKKGKLDEVPGEGGVYRGGKAVGGKPYWGEQTAAGNVGFGGRGEDMPRGISPSQLLPHSSWTSLTSIRDRERDEVLFLR